MSEVVDGPAWVAAEPLDYVGENPLAVSRHVTAESRKLATVAISTTFHARYYTLHALVADECDSRELTVDAQRELLRRCEVVLAAITILHQDAHDSPVTPHGVRAVGGALSGNDLDVARLAGTGPGAYSKRQWGFFWDYGAVEQDLGFVRMSSGGLSIGPNADTAAIRAGLGVLLTLAESDRVPLEILRERSDLCLCRMASAEDGRALRERLLPAAVQITPEPMPEGSAQTIRMLLILLELAGGGDGTLQDDLGDRLLFDPAAHADPRLIALDATAAWTGLLLREKSVRAWHRLWAWTVAQIDGAATVEAIAAAVANELPPCSLAAYLSDLPPHTAPGGDLLPAEVAVDQDQSRSVVDRWFATLLLGAVRANALPVKVAAYFEGGEERGSRLRPGWLRERLDEWAERPVQEFAVFITEQMVARAQQITLSKARFNTTTCLFDVDGARKLDSSGA
ncbi:MULTISPECIES: hypothetical protein [Microbacterium]|uniref:hypothetical protein n=1 Tax=Microbacterium TaxID=33882 RepID=UPI0034502050